MTLNELSTTFDILYNNISSNQAPGLTEYEKSVFLTQAQEAVILDIYKGVAGDSFETTEEVTRYLNSLVKTIPVSQLTSSPFMLGIKETSVNLPSDVWFITYQAAQVNGRDVIVIPTKQDSLYNELKNPFRGPNKNRILCISEENKLTLYSKEDVQKYYLKYLSRPHPIILKDLEVPNDMTIGNKATSKEIDWLPESLHIQILLRAVQIAKAVWAS